MFRSVQNRLTKNMDSLNRMAGCRSVRAFVAAQSELMRDNVQLMIDTNRRIAALSVRIADEAAGAIQAAGEGWRSAMASSGVDRETLREADCSGEADLGAQQS